MLGILSFAVFHRQGVSMSYGFHASSTDNNIASLDNIPKSITKLRKSLESSKTLVIENVSFKSHSHCGTLRGLLALRKPYVSLNEIRCISVRV